MKFGENNDLTTEVLPRFIEWENIENLFKDSKHQIELIPLSVNILKELALNVESNYLTSESLELIEREIDQIPPEYGSWMYYPRRKKCIQVLPKQDFIELRTCRNRYKISREEQLKLSEKSIAIVGLSAGNAVANALVTERICGRVILFDFDKCELSNLNRLNGTLFEIGLNKTLISATSILERDPYINIELHQEGYLDSQEQRDILKSVDLIVDECDSFEIKILLREFSKEFKKPILMHTSERGITDIERFDLIENLPIFHGLLDGIDCGDKQKVLLALINPQIVSERMLYSFSEIGKSLQSWPQLATEVFAGGANIASIARMILLNQKVNSGRYFFNVEAVGK